ncbi:MAG: sigma 54-interacting transcriptional regulator [Ardenticatenia bacterium]|nr:sigma 54-interacting transcriptional regulator [Ardenticatenia bacterium]
MEHAVIPAPAQSLTDPVAVDPVVHRSWRRCRLRFNPHVTPHIVRANPVVLNHICLTYADLIAVARPFMEDIHQFVEGSGYVVLLTDNTGCIVDLLGDPSALRSLADVGIEQGIYWSEGLMGTNAIALALVEAMPVQITGSQHFFHAHHGLTCSAAPVHDARGRIIGVLAMAGRAETAHPHTLAIVMAAARAITNQFQTDMYLQEANRRLAELNSVFGAISEGVLSWNSDGIITHINHQAGLILGVVPRAVLGRRLSDVVELPERLLNADLAGGGVRDVEATLRVVNGVPVDCLVSLQPVCEGQERVIGCILTLRPIERVRRLVHRLVGARATFTLNDVLGQSPAMQRVRHQARLAAKGQAPVLLRGEPGVGKTPLAQAIHNESMRATGPFITLNCRAIPHELMVSEFLGYEGGAFSGAVAEGRPSKFELADGGTLYLEEIDALSLEMQAALLQTINTGHVLRLGGDAAHSRERARHRLHLGPH